jgi:hypothetical protein
MHLPVPVIARQHRRPAHPASCIGGGACVRVRVRVRAWVCVVGAMLADVDHKSPFLPPPPVQYVCSLRCIG